MTEADTNKSNSLNNNTIIIVVTIVLLAVIFMWFRDRQQKRDLQLERLDTQMDVMEEWKPPRQNTANQQGGRVF